MTPLKASQARIPPGTFSRVAYQGERVRVERRGSKPIFLIGQDDLNLLEKLEGRYWAQKGRRALDEFKRSGKKAVPLVKLKLALGNPRQ